MKTRLALVLGLACLMVVGASASSMTISPGSTPAHGYLPLSLFSMSPIAGMEDDSFVNFSVPSFTYAGQSWTTLGVESNGYVVAGGATSSSATPTSLPDAG